MGVGYDDAPPFASVALRVSIAGAILGGGLQQPRTIVTIINRVSIAGAILGGGLPPTTRFNLIAFLVSIAGAILGGGLLTIQDTSISITNRFNRGGDSWGWATLLRLIQTHISVKFQSRGRFLGVGYATLLMTLSICSIVSIAGAILGGGLLMFYLCRI